MNALAACHSLSVQGVLPHETISLRARASSVLPAFSLSISKCCAQHSAWKEMRIQHTNPGSLPSRVSDGKKHTQCTEGQHPAMRSVLAKCTKGNGSVKTTRNFPQEMRLSSGLKEEGFPGGPNGAKKPLSNGRGYGFDPWLEN